MPSGAEAFQRRQAQRQSQRAAQSAGSISADYFKIDGGTYAIVRFLEQGSDLVFADVHRIPVIGRTMPMDLICLDNNDDGTPCPGCQHEVPKVARRVTKGYMNLIWRDGPVYERNEFGSPKKDSAGKPIIIGRADGVFLWKCSGDVFTDIVAKDSAFKGLSSRDCKITRVGSGMNDTKYSIDPADIDAGPQPMTIADRALAAEKSYNLAEITTPLSYQDFVLAMHGATTGQTGQEGPQPTMDRSSMIPTAESVFSGGAPVQASAFRRG